jgi:hypothetical protein
LRTSAGTQASIATNVRRVMTSEANRRADLEVRGAGLMQQLDTLSGCRHATWLHWCRSRWRPAGHAMARHSTRAVQSLEEAGQQLKRSASIAAQTQGTAQWPSCLPACLQRAAFRASSCACSSSSLTAVFSEEGGRWGTGSGTEAAAGTGLGSGSPTTRETSPPLTSMRSPSRGRSSLHCSLEHWHRQVHASSYVCRNMNE